MKRILITGGTGSFGSAMINRLLKDDSAEEIVIFSRDEKKQHDMSQAIKSPKVRYFIGDTRDIDVVRAAMKGVDTVFHAAALKQVPTGEFFPMEVVKTNILGTQNVFDAAEEAGVEKVVLLSTDKAVYPINAMGISKSMAEKLVSARASNKSKTIFCTVRYGNVMATRGSAIPLFVDKIKNKESLPVTNPEMTRFLLSLDDAIDLVLFAIKEGRNGDLFVKKAPAVTIKDLTQALLNIFKANNEIKIVGTRAGEKVHETLVTELELAKSEDMGDFFRIMSHTQDYKKYYHEGADLETKGDFTSENTKRLSIKETEELLLKLNYINNQLR